MTTKEVTDRLVELGIHVLIIEETEIIIIKSFEPNKTSGIEAVSYNNVYGWDMTKYFLNRQQEIESVFLNKLNVYMEVVKPIRMKFSSDHKWRCYTS